MVSTSAATWYSDGSVPLPSGGTIANAAESSESLDATNIKVIKRPDSAK